MSEGVTIRDVEVIAETSKAILVEFDGDELWVPQSVIHADSEVWAEGDKGDLIVKSWWAREKGLD